LGPECSRLITPVPDSSDKITEVLMFWFGHIPGRSLGRGARRQILKRLPFWAGNWGRRFWDVDRAMRERFGDDLVRAGRGEHDDWASTPVGRLALILLLDQFSRNIHRGTPEAFAYDAKTIGIALEGLEREEDQAFYPLVRSFFYLPLVHQEEIGPQERAVRAYRAAMREAWGFQWTILFAEYCSAVRHRDIIRRFGRFPHRNRIFGRPSTRAELRFLKQPFSHF
jgi:uncharacterized protein (DUF924 family)